MASYWQEFFTDVKLNTADAEDKLKKLAQEGELGTQYHKTLAMTLNLLRSENWGATEQARHFIGHLYDEYTFFFETHRNATYTDWNGNQQTIEEAEETLRTKMGERQMDDILDAFRRGAPNRLEPYRDLISLIVKFTDTWATKGGATLRAPVSHRLARSHRTRRQGAGGRGTGED